MLNKYPWWKNLIIVVSLLLALLYALPNLYGEDPALQISAIRGATVDDNTKNSVAAALQQAGLNFKSGERIEQSLLFRFADTDLQLKAQDVAKTALGEKYVVALNLAPATPGWLAAINAKPMFLGLDLRGGVHFLMEVDMVAALQQKDEQYVSDIRTLLRNEKIHYQTLGRRSGGGVEMTFKTADERTQAQAKINRDHRTLALKEVEAADAFGLQGTVGEQERRETQRLAVQQNVTILRNRVNELGVAEPLIQQQGINRIVVQLPGIQDTARAKDILSATATLEFRLVDDSHNAQEAAGGKVPVGAKLYQERGTGRPVLLQKRVIVTGDQITGASSGIDSRDGTPQVTVHLDGRGAKSMLDTTKENVGKPMAVVFIENKVERKTVDGKIVSTQKRVEEVINVATIREPFGPRFQITGLSSTNEARDLALLLRAGALSAPISIVEERTVGPSLGVENIAKGFNSTVGGFIAVAILMTLYYMLFGFVASVALFSNIVLMIAVLSMMQATLTLPGMAGIALTVGMAIDSNVLIFERIREELRAGNSPQAAIHAGYERAWGTIFDSNITILIAGAALLLLGSGPVRGFAVVLCIGILTSMFSAVVVSRSMVNAIYGGRRKVVKLPIG